MSPSTIGFLAGMTAMGDLLAGVFFIRFWRATRDRLFLAFAAAFWLLGLTHSLLGLSGGPAESQASFYLLRLAAFILIIFAVAAKNLKGNPDS